ncbi:MAG TPA: ATP-binding protein [Thermomicrobiales bacterium]|nr:ATP-binding protein [Thermomicrobiales bacterium]
MRARILSVPLFYKVLIANLVIVLLGAVVGTYVTTTVARNSQVPSREGLVLIFLVVGVLVSGTVNIMVLRAAFQPLDTLEQVADAVRRGDLSARAHPITFSDPQLARLAETFNDTLEMLQQDQAQLRQLASQVIRAQEDERKRVARELHDDTAQILFAQLLRVTALKSSPEEDVRRMAEQLENMTVEAIEGVRRLALELRPPALDDLGLREALADLAQRFSEQLGIPVLYHETGLRGRLHPDIELVLYRVAQEALTNSAKHAGATQIWVSIVRTEYAVSLSIDDDGIGISSPSSDGKGLGLGLFGMEERVALVGGELIVRPLQPTGVGIVANIPISRSRDLNRLMSGERIRVP